MKKVSCYFLILLWASAAGFYPSAAAADQGGSVYGRVVKVVDGDTVVVKLDRGPVKVRLIGVDTPEKNASDKLENDSHRFGQSKKELKFLGKESSEITKRLVNGKTVRLSFDEEKTDKYGRTLAYVYFLMKEKDFVKKMDLVADFPLEKTERQFFLNRVLVEYGYALAYRKFHYRYKDEFIALERTAQQEQLGLWRPDKKKRVLKNFPADSAVPAPH